MKRYLPNRKKKAGIDSTERIEQESINRWSSPMPFVAPLFISVGYSMVRLPFTAWIFIVFLIDPDTVITVINIPYLFKMFVKKKD